MRDNVIWIDFQPTKEWRFKEGVEDTTGIKWKTVIKINNKQKGKFSNLKRYFRYFSFSICNFLRRKKFSKILAWQQFYGLMFAFFCRLFHVRKKNQLFIMTFIYIPKSGMKGRIYFRFMKFILTSKYIDKLFVFSSSEIKKYCKEFSISKEKFEFVPLGEDIINSTLLCNYNPGFIFSSGYSNRDFDFLIDALKETKYCVRIFGKKCGKIENIILSDEYVGNKLTDIFSKARIVVVPLKENREGGQLTVIHAMEAGIPIIATNTDSMKDYIVDGVNGFLCPNVKEIWINKINLLYSDNELYSKMSQNCKKQYVEKHTVLAFGKNIGKSIFEYDSSFSQSSR